MLFKKSDLINPHFLSSVCVPNNDGAVIVRRCQRAFVERAPGDAADLRSADHLDARVVDVDHVLQDDLIVVQLDAFCHAGNRKELLHNQIYEIKA